MKARTRVRDREDGRLRGLMSPLHLDFSCSYVAASFGDSEGKKTGLLKFLLKAGSSISYGSLVSVGVRTRTSVLGSESESGLGVKSREGDRIRVLPLTIIIF